jgi:hypothetical protein
VSKAELDENDVDALLIRPGTPVHWGEGYEFVAPIVKIIHNDLGHLQLVTTCAVPLNCDVYVKTDLGFGRVGQTTGSAYRDTAYRQISVGPNVLCEDPYLEEPFHSRTPRLASPLRTFSHDTDEMIGFLAATNTQVEILAPSVDGTDDRISIIASILRLYDPKMANDVGFILGKHLIDASLRTAGIAVAINEDEGYVVLAPPIDMAEAMYDDADSLNIAGYAISGASFADPETGLLLVDNGSDTDDPTASELDDAMKHAKARMKLGRDQGAAA